MNQSSVPFVKTLILTILALCAFAANSVLCRAALGKQTIDAAGFTILRLLSGAVVLFILLQFRHTKIYARSKGSWTSGTMLFLYAVSFSFSYISLDTGTGALVLFSSVQITMIFLSLMSGYRLLITEWVGVLIAFGGFVYLIMPGVSTPSLTGFVLMTISGIAWGVYTLRGRASEHPLADTAYNFMKTVPFIIILAIITIQNMHYSSEGIMLAVLSGGITSGIGYIIWYAALSGLSATLAAVVQLFVPVMAALGGVLFMSEAVTLRLTLSAVMILGGIFLVIQGRSRSLRKQTTGASPRYQ